MVSDQYNINVSKTYMFQFLDIILYEIFLLFIQSKYLKMFFEYFHKCNQTQTNKLFFQKCFRSKQMQPKITITTLFTYSLSQKKLSIFKN